MAEKKKDPKFGGKRSLKDMDKSGGANFGDTFLGDLLGFDKDGGIGTKGKPGLLASLRGARRKKPVAATTKKKVVKKVVRPKLRPKPAANPPVRRGDGTEAGVKKRYLSSSGEQHNQSKLRVPKDKDRNVGKAAPKVKMPQKDNPKLYRKGKPLTVLEKVELSRKALKRITKTAWDNMKEAERVAMNLPKNRARLNQLLAGSYKNNTKELFKQPPRNLNKGGVAKKSCYMYGGSVVKKKPATKMMAGGMAKKKPVARMNKGGMTKKK